MYFGGMERKNESNSVPLIYTPFKGAPFLRLVHESPNRYFLPPGWQSDNHDYSFKLSLPTHCFVDWKTARKFDRSQKAKQNNGGSKSLKHV